MFDGHDQDGFRKLLFASLYQDVYERLAGVILYVDLAASPEKVKVYFELKVKICYFNLVSLILHPFKPISAGTVSLGTLINLICK